MMVRVAWPRSRPKVPEGKEEFICEGSGLRRDLRAEENHDIDIRVDTELPSPVSAHCDEGQGVPFSEKGLTDGALFKPSPEVVVHDPGIGFQEGGPKPPLAQTAREGIPLTASALLWHLPWSFSRKRSRTCPVGPAAQVREGLALFLQSTIRWLLFLTHRCGFV